VVAKGALAPAADISFGPESGPSAVPLPLGRFPTLIRRWKGQRLPICLFLVRGAAATANNASYVSALVEADC